MPIYQNASVTDAKLEVGNFVISTAATGTTAGGTWVNLGAGMVNGITYAPEDITTQAGNSIDPLEGIARETATVSLDLIEYDGSAFSAFSGAIMTGTSASLTIGGVRNKTARGLKLVNTRILATGSTQTTTWVMHRVFLQAGWSYAPKSDNDSDPVGVYSFEVLVKPHATAQTLMLKTVT